jgi:Rieske Fe-S protein
MSLTDTTRRRWVKQFIFGSAAALIGPRWVSTVLADVTSTGPGPGVIRLKASAFPALVNPGGSVQFNFIQNTAPLTLNRVAADRFVALDSICTHAGCTVGRFITANNRMTCPCHGSRYDIEGRVIRGPAEEPLAQFATSYDAASDIICITLPDLALHIQSISVHQQGENGQVRVKLVFPVSLGAIYEIRYQPDLATPSQLVSYATTPSGVANKTTVGPEIFGDFTAYVDTVGPRGFFSIGVRLSS